jgi:hypothetical protein
MSKQATELAIIDDFSAISQYYTSGKSDELPDYQKEILDRWRSANKILMKFPKKSIAARRLQALYPNITIRQAQIDIDNACKFWNLVDPADKGFLQRWLIDFLSNKMGSNSIPEAIKAKYAATFEKLVSSIEEAKLDPKLMEKNNIYIQLNVNNNNINLTEKEIQALPRNIRAKILTLGSGEINEDEAIEIMNS